MERPTFRGEEPLIWIKNKICLMALIAQVRSLMAISNQLLLYEMLGTLLADFFTQPNKNKVQILQSPRNHHCWKHSQVVNQLMTM